MFELAEQIEYIVDGNILRPGRAHDAESAAAKSATPQVEGSLTPIPAEIVGDVRPLAAASFTLTLSTSACSMLEQ